MSHRRVGDAPASRKRTPCAGACPLPEADQVPHQRATATVLVLTHSRRRAAPAVWLPDILCAHSLPLMAKALDDILTYGEVLPF